MSTDPSSPPNDPNLSGLGRELLGTNQGSKPSGPWVPPTAEELHAILPQYEIVKMLGRGGMGAVYMGRQTALDRPVAVKILSAQLEESDMGFTERFKNEARAMGKLNHPAVVAVYEFGQHESGLLYIVMEFVDGTDVAKMIAKSGRLHTEHAMAITAHVCDALAYAHERGIIHRDIKPANIMVGYDGAVKVADFGLAKVSVGGQTLGLTQSGMAMGTMHYMAPEALMLGTSVDHRADIYAVGVMLYQMLTGKLPQGMFKLPSLLVPGLDPRYDAIVRKALMEDREVRYQNIRDMRTELDSILTQPVMKVEPTASAAEVKAAALSTGARPQRPGGRPPAPAASTSAQTISHERQRGSLAWLWVLLLMLAGGGAWYFSTSKKPLSTVSGGVSTSRSSIILRTPDAARILPLEKGRPRLYDSNPLRVIEEIDPSLAGWQFTSIPQRIDNAYEVSVSQSGTLYAFGGLHKGYTKEDVFGKDAPLWKAADQAIQGTMIKMCYSREVKAGDFFQMKAFELQLAATQITLEIKPAAAEHGKNTAPPAAPNRKEPSVVTTPAAMQAPTTGDSSKQATDVWISLFNGKDLSGWELHPSNFPADVFGGLIRIRGSSTIPVSGNMYYRGSGSTLPQWTDFELICTVMTENKGNSGIFLHSSPGMPDKNRANGVEVQIWNTITNASTGPTGSLQRITSSGNQLFKDGEWFQVKVRVEAKRVQTWLKRPTETMWKQGVDWTQPATWTPPSDRPGIQLGSGTISLQNNPPIDGVVWFKDIQFRELNASPAQATTMTAASTTLPAAQPEVLEFTSADPVSGWSFISTRGARWPEVDATGLGHAILESTDETVHPNNNMSAPRLLRDVTGDFTLETSLDFSGGGSNKFAGSGLLLWHDDMNFIRLERIYADWQKVRHGISLQGRVNGVYKHWVYTDTIPTQATHVELRLQRKGGQIIASWLDSGKNWLPVGTVDVSWPAKLQAGIVTTALRGGPVVKTRFDRVTLSTATPASPVTASSLLPAAMTSAEEGFVPLFQNDSISGWTGDLSSYQMRNGILSGGSGNLINPKEYGDFSLKFDLRLAAGSYVEMSIRGQNPPQPNSGAPNASFGVVLRDNTETAAAALEPWKRHGAVYGYQEPLRTSGGTVGTWNEHEVRVENQHLTVTINGVIVQDTDLRNLTRKAPGGRSLDLSRTRGQIAILGFKGTTEFRNVRIKELGAVTTAATAPTASATLWIDTKGRSLQAKFVRVEGGNVMLDIAGKVTSVALATLSTASQEMARQLAASMQVSVGTASSSAPDPEAGFISLLDADQPGDWVQVGPGKLDIQNGLATTSSPIKWGVAIYSKRTFADFILKAEFKGVGPLFNSGLWLRIPDLRNDILSAAANRYEVGIINPGGDKGRFTGTIWGIQSARVDAVKANDWNELEVTVTGQRYVVKLNGQIVNDFIGNKGALGYIGLEENGEPGGGPVQFRNVRVKPLP